MSRGVASELQQNTMVLTRFLVYYMVVDYAGHKVIQEKSPRYKHLVSGGRRIFQWLNDGESLRVSHGSAATRVVC